MAQAITLPRSADDQALTGATRQRRPRLKHVLLAAAAIGGLAVAADYGTDYWRNGRFMVETDDAYVQADNTLIAPRVSGYISQVLVTDNQTVKAGQVLARIDDRDFQTALRGAVADREAAEGEISAIDAQLVLQTSTIEEARQQVSAADAELRFAEQDHVRYDLLSRSGAATTQSEQRSNAERLQSSAGLLRARAALAAAQQQVGVLQASRIKAQAQLKHYQAAEEQARLNLGYTTITAPEDGVIGARTLRVGQYVQAGTQLMAVVPLDNVYVIANYKETQLTDVHPGQSVDISVDTFPGTQLHGRVDSVAPASGLQFALLPADNATGNFTKIVQRLPVKIVLDKQQAAAWLRPGMSVEPSIDIRTGDSRTASSATP
jgi:membrane fusion protein (multidrug efflux system)